MEPSHLQDLERQLFDFVSGVLGEAQAEVLERRALASVLSVDFVGVLPGFDFKTLLERVGFESIERLLAVLHHNGHCGGLAGTVLSYELLKRKGLLTDWSFEGLDGQIARFAIMPVVPVDFISINVEWPPRNDSAPN